MKMKMTGNMIMKSHRRMAGTYQIAYAVETPSGKTGTALFVYEYDKRDVMVEEVITTPEIAKEVKAFLGDDSPSAFDCFRYPTPEEENTNGGAVTDAIAETSEIVYGWEA